MSLTFSVVIPTFNRPTQLRACLEALANIEYSNDAWEVIVVDDGGSQPLDAVVRDFTARLPVCLLRQENAGPAAARNRGAQEARGRFLAFTDDDCAPDKLWLRHLEEALQRHPQALVGGHTLNALRDNAYAGASQLLIDYLYEQWNMGAAQFFASNNMAVSRKPFLEMGGFDTTFTRAASEDREWCERWIASGRELFYAPKATIRHAHNLSLRTLWRQHFAYGSGAWQFHQARVARGGQFWKPRLSFYTGLLRYPCGAARRRQTNYYPLAMMALLILTQAAALAGFLSQKRRAR
jgi:glycosyltransferase involved in cell wall biosynthesis